MRNIAVRKTAVAPGEAYTFWSAVALVCIAVPLWSFALPPCADLPQHIALAALLLRLAQHDSVALTTYALNVQPVPYWLLYALLVPALRVLGAVTAGKALLSLLAALLVASTRLCLRTLAAPAVLMLCVPICFFGPLFYFGLVATMLGLPAVLLCAYLVMLRPGPTCGRHLLLGVAATLWATLAHALLALPCGLIALHGLLSGRRRQLGAVLASAAALPLVLALLRLLFAKAEGAGLTIEPAHLAGQWHSIKMLVGPFDHGLGRAAHVAMLALLGAVALLARRHPGGRASMAAPVAGRRGPLLYFGLGLLALFALTPHRVVHAQTSAWGLDLRFLALLEWTLCLALVPPLVQIRRRLVLRRLLATGLLACVLVHGGAQWRLWRVFNQQAVGLLAMLRAVPPGADLHVCKGGAAPFAGTQAPLLHHLALYDAAARGALHDDLFVGAHLPVRLRADAPQKHAAERYLLLHPGAAIPAAFAQHQVVQRSGGFVLLAPGSQAR